MCHERKSTIYGGRVVFKKKQFLNFFENKSLQIFLCQLFVVY